MTCHCGSGLEFAACCEPIITGKKPAPTAEALMRSRYSAYAEKAIDYLEASHIPEKRSEFDPAGAREWAERAKFLELDIRSTTAGGENDERGEVEFVARFADEKGREHRHHERSTFVKREGRWYFRDGEVEPQAPVVRSAPKVGRNDPCPCGSGKKYKKCCGPRAA